MPAGSHVQLSERRLDAALQAFSQQAAQYCAGISESSARRYAEEYAAALAQRARNAGFREPHGHGLFAPNRNLIRTALNLLYRSHFPRRRRRRAGAAAVL